MTCRRICTQHYADIPRAFQRLLSVLLRLDEPGVLLSPDKYGALFRYPFLSEQQLPAPSADLLLHAGFSIIPFPDYFLSVYELLYKYHVIEQEIDVTDASVVLSAEQKSQQLATLRKSKVLLFTKYLNRSSFNDLGAEGIELLVPYIQHLFSDVGTMVHAIWMLFAPASMLLGSQKTVVQLMPYVVAVFDTDVTTSKHMKLYHRSFIIQLIVRLGLETFLQNFSKPLIEACSSFKDFRSSADVIDAQFSADADDIMQCSITDVFLSNERSQQSAGCTDVDAATGDEPGRDEATACSDDDAANTSNDHDFIERVLFENKPTTDQFRGGRDQRDDVTSESDSLHDDSTSSANGGDVLASSVGRLSIHSVSRLLDEASQQQHSAAAVDEIAAQATELDATDDSQRLDSTRLQDLETTATDMTTTAAGECNISELAAETIKWLSHRLGPVLTAKFLTRNLLRMLAVCYLGSDQLLDATAHASADVAAQRLSGRVLAGDVNASKLLDCLAAVAVMYGEHVVLLQYFMHVKQLVRRRH